jgi:hypothetical protein
VLALICHIELFVLAHYRESIDKDTDLSPLFKDVLFFHAREEAQHAILDELEWRRANATVSAAERDAGVDDFIALVAGVDGLLQMQATADARYFAMNCGRELSEQEQAQTASSMLAAYRWQYIVSGAQEKRFADILAELCTTAQMQRIGSALTPLRNRRGGHHEQHEGSAIARVRRRHRRAARTRRNAVGTRRRSHDDQDRPRRSVDH